MPSDGGRSFFWSFETSDPLTALTLRPVECLMTPVALAVGHFWAPAGPLILWGLSALHATAATGNSNATSALCLPTLAAPCENGPSPVIRGGSTCRN